MESVAASKIYEYLQQGLDKPKSVSGQRIGTELKFPLVEQQNGCAVKLETVNALWSYLIDRGWEASVDPVTNKIVGATKPGEYNDTLASCETGFCKIEFSLAHVGDLHALTRQIDSLIAELIPFANEHQVSFLGCGIHPVSPPSPELVIAKQRTLAWDTLFPEGEIVNDKPRPGLHLFTVNSGSHVHLSVSSAEEAVGVTNVFNGFAGAQIALMGNSSVWRGKVDSVYQCVAEKFWDWWMLDEARVGLPSKCFTDIEDYGNAIARLRPLYVERNENPILISHYPTFADYYDCSPATGKYLSGEEVVVYPEAKDIKLHNSFYWFTARISRYFTVENRLCDQQVPGDLACPAALSLGLLKALPEAQEELNQFQWSTLKLMREAAMRKGLDAKVEGIALADMAGRMLELATLGLERRGLGEEVYLEPLQQRLTSKQNPAMEASEIFSQGGIKALIEARDILVGSSK
ncbi:gamma-glutamylcysteine synthetase [Rivularia sp. PCC 7116]|uniref:glutamate-cysteine ligase family protein n=1 Tax=Rivularia sp. PCC 7116 TaxID=373994 RepID=UPI00029F01A2|nr:glutamate-cysteine ligase family protein [Rivularia sp. PCC 7116]AFY55320.1 gamma-glutamylcysteine synthetase [Rivularia sp. PCC 7116]